MLIRLTPAIKSTPNDENINSISRWMTRNILFTLNRKLCSLAVLSLLLIVQYLHKKYLIYYYRIITHFSQYNNILLCKSTRLKCQALIAKFFQKIFSAYFTTNMHFHIHHICFCPTTPNPPVTAGFF